MGREVLSGCAVRAAIQREHSVADIMDVDLVRRAVMNVRPERPGRWPRWSAVSESFGLGSTFATQLCKRFALDPDELLDGPVCEHCAEHEEGI